MVKLLCMRFLACSSHPRSTGLGQLGCSFPAVHIGTASAERALTLGQTQRHICCFENISWIILALGAILFLVSITTYIYPHLLYSSRKLTHPMTVVNIILTLLSYRTFVGTSVWSGGWVGLSLVPAESAQIPLLLPLQQAHYVCSVEPRKIAAENTWYSGYRVYCED